MVLRNGSTGSPPKAIVRSNSEKEGKEKDAEEIEVERLTSTKILAEIESFSVLIGHLRFGEALHGMVLT